MKYFLFHNARKIFVAFIFIAIVALMIGTTIANIGFQLIVAGFVLSIPLLLLYRTENPIYSALYGAAIALTVPTVYRLNGLLNTTAIDWVFSLACIGIGVFLLPATAKRFTESFTGV